VTKNGVPFTHWLGHSVLSHPKIWVSHCFFYGTMAICHAKRLLGQPPLPIDVHKSTAAASRASWATATRKELPYTGPGRGLPTKA